MKCHTALFLLIFLVGCGSTPTWIRPPNKSESDYYNDRLQCDAIARRIDKNYPDNHSDNCMRGKGYRTK